MQVQIQSRTISCPFKDVQTQVPLSSLTTLELGGPARLFISLTSSNQALEVFRWIKQNRLPFWILGGGSNLICADEGIDGVVVQFKMDTLQSTLISVHSGQKQKVEVYVEAGLSWCELVSYCVGKGWAGIECLAGIPGLVGAAPIQNIGAYGASLSDVCTHVLVYDFENEELRWWTADECQWSYRSSHFKTHPHQYAIFALKLILSIDEIPPIRYAQLERALHPLPPSSYTLDLIYQEVLKLRRSKSMVWDRQDPNHRSAGSFFLNPLCTLNEFKDLQHRVHAVSPSLSIPHWQEGNRIKTAKNRNK